MVILGPVPRLGHLFHLHSPVQGMCPRDAGGEGPEAAPSTWHKEQRREGRRRGRLSLAAVCRSGWYGCVPFLDFSLKLRY